MELLKQFINMDLRKLPTVDIVHDVEDSRGFPLPDNCVNRLLASHILEHICPKRLMFVMSEIHRVCKHEAQVFISVPYGGSMGSIMDPTHCFVEGTEVLTSNGFKPMQDVQLFEDLVVLNTDTMKTETSPCIGKIHRPYTGNMVHFKTRRIDLLVTPNHDIISRSSYTVKKKFEKDRADKFLTYNGHHPRIGTAELDWVGEERKTISIPRIKHVHGRSHRTMPITFDAEDFMQFMGWFLSEGYTLKKTRYSGLPMYRVGISQCPEYNKENYESISRLLTRMDFRICKNNKGMSFSSKDMHSYLIPLGGSKDKYIPDELKKLSKRLLSKMLESMFKGDGCSNGTNSCTYATISKRLANDVHEIALKCGYRATIGIEKRKNTACIRERIVNQSETMYLVYISKQTELYLPKPKLVPYEGNIACVTAKDNHNIMVRRNGKAMWAGNCAFFNEATFRYFDDREGLWNIYQPPILRIQAISFDMGASLEIVLVVIKDRKMDSKKDSTNSKKDIKNVKKSKR